MTRLRGGGSSWLPTEWRRNWFPLKCNLVIYSKCSSRICLSKWPSPDTRRLIVQGCPCFREQFGLWLGTMWVVFPRSSCVGNGFELWQLVWLRSSLWCWFAQRGEFCRRLSQLQLECLGSSARSSHRRGKQGQRWAWTSWPSWIPHRG